MYTIIKMDVHSSENLETNFLTTENFLNYRTSLGWNIYWTIINILCSKNNKHVGICS